MKYDIQKIIVALCLIGVLLNTSVASATTVFTEDFESYADEAVLAGSASPNDCYTLIAFPGTGSGDDGSGGADPPPADAGGFATSTGTLKNATIRIINASLPIK